MADQTAPEKIKTRILIISDTHGHKLHTKADGASTEDELETGKSTLVPTGFREPLPAADVAIHCGDLTVRTTLKEYDDTFSMLRAIQAPLKLVIAGNHDLALDAHYWRENFSGGRIREGEQNKEVPAKVRQIIDAAKADGVQYLDEGVHEFTLENGARLKVYSSQYTPVYGGWAFQYEEEHNFDIPFGVDVAMTHGPPYGVLDEPHYGGRHAGCAYLFDAVHKARPKIHCFGHIHEAWGMLHVQWKEGSSDEPTDIETVADEERSFRFDLQSLTPNRRVDDEETQQKKSKKLVDLSKKRGIHVNIGADGEKPLVVGEQTLFINAAIMSLRYRPTQMPFVIDMDLDKAGGEQA